MNRLLFEGAAILTCDEQDNFIEHGSVLIEGRLIAAVNESVGDKPFLPEHQSEDLMHVNAEGCVVVPGFVNGHTHMLIGLIRGVSDDLTLFPWIRDLAPHIAQLNLEDFRRGIRMGIQESLLSGTTCLCECGRYDPQIAAEEATKLGLRVITGGMPMSQFFDATVTIDYQRLVDRIEAMRRDFGQPPGMVTGFLGAHSTYNCSSEAIQEGKYLADKLGLDFFIHLAECKDEVDYIRERFGKTPVHYLADLAVLDEHSVGIHCVWLTDEDIRILSETGTRVIHCPTSNAKLASGVMRLAEVRAAGIPVGLGTDSVVSNNRLSVSQEMWKAVLMQRAYSLEPLRLTAQEAIRMATIEGARALGMDHYIGSVEVGKFADLLVIRLGEAEARDKRRVISDLVYAVYRDDIQQVYINGDLVVENGKIIRDVLPEIGG